MNRAMAAVLIVLGVLAVAANGALFTVQQTEQVIVTQLGEPVRSIEKPGLYVKIPLIQNVLSFDRRILAAELPGEEVILGDTRRLIVDSFTLYRITNPLLFYQTVGGTEIGIRARLTSVVSASLRRVLGGTSLLGVLSADRTRIMAQIRDQVGAEMKPFGITVEDVRIRRADLPEGNTQAILQRMQSERVRIAAQVRAEGTEAAQRIRADAERDRTVLLADARANAEKLRGQGEAEATRIFAKSFGEDQNFFTVWRTFQAYKASLGTNGGRLVLSPDNEFLRMLKQAPVSNGPSSVAGR
jgi:membrane protease subunit HflC